MYTTVSGTDTTAKHYGTIYTTADYSTKTQSFFINGHVLATDRIVIHGMAMMNMSTAELDPVVMPAVTDEVATALSHQDFTFDNMHTYSNLDYELLRVSLGVDYKLTSDLTFTVNGDFADLKDNAGYVYGDESGQFYLIRTGIKFDF